MLSKTQITLCSLLSLFPSFLFVTPLAFRCAYCYFLNPARKTRPQAPRLPEFSYERRLRAESRSPGPAPRSGTDTEESAPPSGGNEKTQDTRTSTKQAQHKTGPPRVSVEKTMKLVCVKVEKNAKRSKP